MEHSDLELKLNAREEIMRPIQNRLENDIQFRNLILAIRDAAISESCYRPDTTFDAIFRDMLPPELKNLGLTYDEILVLSMIAKVAKLIAKEVDKVEVHLIELLPSPQRYEHWLEKGKIILSNKLFWNSIHCFDKAIEINPKCAEAWYLKGYCFFQLGSFTTKICTAKRPRTTNMIWSQLESLKNTLLKALDCFDKAIEINPQYMDAHYHKGTCLIEIGRPQNDLNKVKEAIMCFKRVLSIDPSNKNAKIAIKMCEGVI
jgi:tetratricopeptide (TPR) repeat protein